MATPQTTEQMKSKIDQEISSKTARKSITPTMVGGVLKDMVDFSNDSFINKQDKGLTIATLVDGKVPESQLPAMGGGGGTPTENPNIKRFPKDVSLTAEHIGLLAMQKVIVLNDPPSGVEDFEVKAFLSNTTPGSPAVAGVYEIELKGLFDITKQDILDNYNNPISGLTFKFYNHSNQFNSGSFEIFYWIFMATTQPYGTPDGDGFRTFADDTEKLGALNYFLSQTDGTATNVTDIFDITTPFYYDSVSDSFKCVLTEKASIIDDFKTFQLMYSAIETETCEIEVITEHQFATKEQITNIVLGTIVGIEEDEVLIDTEPVQTLQMASESDGVIGIAPFISGDNLGYNYAIPWRNGKVIDLYGLFINEDISLDMNHLQSNKFLFQPLTSAVPGGTFLARLI